MALEHFGVIRSAPRPSAGKLAVEIISVALIVFGIFGELGTGLEIASINSQLRGKSAELRSKNADLRSKSDRLLALVTQESGGAIQKAGEANERAAANELEAQQLKAENLKLEDIVAPRSLSLDQQSQIADVCRKFHGHAVLLKSYAIDGEGAALAGQIIATLQAAHVTVADSRAATMVVGEFDTGVHVRAPMADLVFAYAIADALSTIGKLKVFPVNDPEPKTSGISGGGQTFTDTRAVFVTVSVGIKPLPILPAK